MNWRRWINNEQQHIKNIIAKILTKTFDIILYPLRLAYLIYDGSDLQSRRKVKKAYKKLKNNIYRILLNEGEVYIADFYVGQENGSYDIVSIGEEYILLHHTKKSAKTIFDEIEDSLRADDSLVVESVGVRDLFKYGYFKEDGRVIKVMIVDKKEIFSINEEV